MAIGLSANPELLPVPGVQLGTAQADIGARSIKDNTDSNRPKAVKDDLALVKCAASTAAAAVFTQNRFCAAPVTVARRHLGQCAPRALIINSGNANAGTGRAGLNDAEHTCGMVAAELGLSAQAVLPFSTGVIGARLPMNAVQATLPRCVDALKEENWLAAARAIMTTDTVPKGGSRRFDLDGVPLTLTGIAKGSGMIRPDMATMLCFAAVDAAVDQAILRALLQHAVENSFNRITIDGDTSTNDACVLMATGCADMSAIIDETDPRFEVLAQNVDFLFSHMAQSLIRDGEGATKFVTIEVSRAASKEDAQKLAFAVAHSPLVKTALFASDPNWGRILAAVGRAEVGCLEISKVGIAINDVMVVASGERAATYTEAAGQKAMSPAEIRIKIDLGLAAASATVWTSDLSYDYVKINAEYRS